MNVAKRSVGRPKKNLSEIELMERVELNRKRASDRYKAKKQRIEELKNLNQESEGQV